MMRRLVLRSFLWSFVLSTFLTFLSEAPLFASETGIFESTSYDFKGIPRYTKPRHSFIFTNQSDDVLRLVAARTSCQCTQVYIPDKREYRKGEKGEVVAEIDAVRFTGPRHATLTLTFERSGRTFEIPLNIVGMVVENVKLTPNRLNFIVDETQDGSASSQTPPRADKTRDLSREQIVTVQYLHSNETAVKATSSSPYVDVKLGKQIRDKDGSSVPVTVSVAKDAPAGYIDATVLIWSNGASRATPLTLDVSGVVRAPLMVSPPALTFFTSPDGKKIVKNIVVSASNPFTLKEIVSDSESISVNVSPKSIRASKVCVVPVSFDPAKLRDESGAVRLQIRTTDGRSLDLRAQISSGNFEANGLVQKDEPTREIDETFAEDENSEDEFESKVSQVVTTAQRDVKIVDAATIPESLSGSEIQAPRIRVGTGRNARKDYIPRDRYPVNGSNQTPPKTSSLPSERLFLH